MADGYKFVDVVDQVWKKNQSDNRKARSSITPDVSDAIEHIDIKSDGWEQRLDTLLSFIKSSTTFKHRLTAITLCEEMKNKATSKEQRDHIHQRLTQFNFKNSYVKLFVYSFYTLLVIVGNIVHVLKTLYPGTNLKN